MILHWDQIVHHYGHGEITRPKRGTRQVEWSAVEFWSEYKKMYLKAENPTYSFLFSPSSIEEVFTSTSGNGSHAEEKLMKSLTWKVWIPSAIDNSISGLSQKFNVILGVSRTPCSNCTDLLVSQIQNIQRRYPLRYENARFILASLGAYKPGETNPDNMRTSIKDLTRLDRSGWELCVLQTKNTLTRNGKILQCALENIGRKGILRLEN
ncbi:hypothetical protein ACJJIX_00350 [Microbulbifer sp. VAAC004]|uniref:hypothetical protein n=1 Tax=unclassified Microbulbifer TaxID=2619833 RepID=UPI004039F131